jgi:hypothetical protein
MMTSPPPPFRAISDPPMSRMSDYAKTGGVLKCVASFLQVQDQAKFVGRKMVNKVLLFALIYILSTCRGEADYDTASDAEKWVN